MSAKVGGGVGEAARAVAVRSGVFDGVSVSLGMGVLVGNGVVVGTGVVVGDGVMDGV